MSCTLLGHFPCHLVTYHLQFLIQVILSLYCAQTLTAINFVHLYFINMGLAESFTSTLIILSVTSGETFQES